MTSGTDLPFILTNFFTSKVNYSRRLEEFVCMNVSVMGGTLPENPQFLQKRTTLGEGRYSFKNPSAKGRVQSLGTFEELSVILKQHFNA